MATSSGTLPISLRGGMLPVLRYSNFAGPGYGASLGDPTSNQPLAPVNTAQPATETIATAGDAAAVAAPAVTPAPNPNSFDAYLSGAGASLTADQQATLSTSSKAWTVCSTGTAWTTWGTSAACWG